MSLVKVLDSIIELVKRKKLGRPRRNYKIMGNHCPKCGTDNALKRWRIWQCVRCGNKELHRTDEHFCAKCREKELMVPFGGYECQYCHWST